MSAAATHTPTNQTIGAESCLASSSSGNACRTRGPGKPDACTAYSQPVHASPTARKAGGSASLRHIHASQVLARRQVGVGRVAAPERPVVAAAHDPEAVPDPAALEQRGERRVLLEEVVVTP